MRPPIRSLTLVLGLVVSACSSAEHATEAAPPEPEVGGEHSSFAELRPHVGDRAPAISLETLAGSRVSLPMSDADRAAVLIFGSFS
jgi:hypothetical protein